jgi:hypothetical protein
MKTLLAITCAVVASATLIAASGPNSPSSSPASDDAVVERFLHSDSPRLASYQARRLLKASSMGGRMTASLEAWTSLDDAGVFHFAVIREAGSRLIREHVLHKALDTEARQHNTGETDQVQLTRVNYDFRVMEESDGLVSIGLLPRRVSPMLLSGTVVVKGEDGDVVRITGQPSKLPSWWTRRVDIVRRYERIAGTRVPVEMSSRADVRLGGESTFVMTYDYTMINGRATP